MQRRSGSAPPTSPLRWDMASSPNTSFFEAAIQAHLKKRAFTPPPHSLSPSIKDPSSPVKEPRATTPLYRRKKTYATMLAAPTRQTPSPSASRKATNAIPSRKGVPQACVFVASLSSQRTDKQLHDTVTHHFKKWGDLLDVKVLKDWRNRPYAFVQYENIQDAHKALQEAQGTRLDGREIRVEQARVNRTLFISHFPLNFTKKDVQVVLEKYGPIEHLNMIHQSSDHPTSSLEEEEMASFPKQAMCDFGVSRPSAFAKFCYRDDAIKAYLELRSVQKWTADWAVGFEKNHSESQVDSKTIFVGQLNQQLVNETLLRDAFGVFGHISSCQLIVRPSRYGGAEKPAFAFIQYDTHESADKAITEMNGKIWLNRVLRVQNREIISDASKPTDRRTGTPSPLETERTEPMTPSSTLPLDGVMFASPSSPCLSPYPDSEMTLSPAPTTLVDPSTRPTTPHAVESTKLGDTRMYSPAPPLPYAYPPFSPMMPTSPYGMTLPMTPPHYAPRAKDGRRFPPRPLEPEGVLPVSPPEQPELAYPPLYYSFYPVMGPHGYPYYPYPGYTHYPMPYGIPPDVHYYNGYPYYGSSSPQDVVLSEPMEAPDCAQSPVVQHPSSGPLE